jgi:xylan 1,4-beta-xylosidase
VCMQSEKFNYVFGITKKADVFYLVLQRTEKGQSTIIASTQIDIKNPVRLQVKAEGENYSFDYSNNGTDFVNLGGPVSGDILSTNVAGGFTGSLIGLYATSANDIQPESGTAQPPAPIKVSDGMLQASTLRRIAQGTGCLFQVAAHSRR